MTGQCFITAGNGRITNLGQPSLRVVTNDGKQAKALYQVGDVHRPLTSNTQTCGNGNIVCASDGGYIYSLNDGSYTRFERHSNVYELDLWLKTEDANDNVDKSVSPGRDNERITRRMCGRNMPETTTGCRISVRTSGNAV